LKHNALEIHDQFFVFFGVDKSSPKYWHISDEAKTSKKPIQRDAEALTMVRVRCGPHDMVL